MINKISSCFFYLIVSYLQAQNKSIVISFAINDIIIEKIDFFIYDKLNDSILKQNFASNVFIITDINNSNNVYFVQAENHVIELPKINYLNDVENIQITYYDNCKKELFEKKHKGNYLKKKGINYQIDFGLGDIYFVNYTKKKSKKIRKIIVSN